LRIVDVTSPPARNAPKNSKIEARITALVIVNALLPTEVPIAFATSLAPIPHAMKSPAMHARAIYKKDASEKKSILKNYTPDN
jgi:hypothetical protein